MFTTVRQRIAAATGAIFVIFVFAGNALNTAGSTGAAHPTGTEVLRDVTRQAHSTGAAAGLALEVLGFAAFTVFLGYLAHTLRRRTDERPGSAAAGTALVAGTTMLAIKLDSAAPFLALSLDRDQLSPQLAQVLNDINGAAFVVSWLPFALFVAAAAAALRDARLVGRPTFYLGLLIGAAGVVLTLLGVNDPVHANPVAFLLGALWVLVVSVRLSTMPRTSATERGDSPAAPAAGQRVPVGA